MPRNILRSVIWERPDLPALEYCILTEDATGYQLRGTVVVRADAAPFAIRYEVACGADWITQHAHVVLERSGVERTVDLTRDPQGQWQFDGTELPDVAGLFDVDLAFTPCTNTLPIRRAHLEIGQSAAVTAVWLRFPELSVQPLPQRYTRLGERLYQYESRGGEFRADLDVDKHGLVVNYGTWWRRLAAS